MRIEYLLAKLMSTHAPICKCAITCTITHVRMCEIVQLVTHSGITANSQSFQSTNNQTYIQSEYVHTRLYTRN